MTTSKRRLTKKDLRDLGASPAMLVRKVRPDGSSQVRQITPDARRTSPGVPQSPQRGPQNPA